MSKQTDEFLSVGMQKYRSASAAMVRFGKEVESRLQAILSKREDWGIFVPRRGNRPKSTKYWSEYPLLNGKIDGKINGADVRLSIDIIWYRSEREYPFYFVWLDPVEPYRKAMAEFRWSGDVSWDEDGEAPGIRLTPKEDDFALERDFGILLSELVRFFKTQTPKRIK
jgi:hypothetical protein